MPTMIHRTAVITMARASEFPAAWSSLKTVEPQLSEDCQQLILLNDSRNAGIESRLAARPYTRLITPGENLGVARGRNRLIEAARQWGATVIVSLDDDILVPADFLPNITRWILERTSGGEKVGVVTPVVLNFAGVADALGNDQWRASIVSGQLSSFASTADIRAMIRRAWPAGIPSNAVYHTGIRNWRRHYLDSYRGIAESVFEVYSNIRGQRIVDELPTELRLDPEILTAISDGTTEPVAIDTAPGGACAFPASMIDTVGAIDEAFSPFGYEDSDFAIRSALAGFHNYLLPSEFVVHDIEGRQEARPTTILLHSQGRARTLLALKHVEASGRTRVLSEIIALAPLQALALTDLFGTPANSQLGNALGAATSYLAGVVDGLFVSKDQRIPTRADKRLHFAHQFRRGGPAAGLPVSLPIDVELAYTWDEETDRFVLGSLMIDSPGAVRLQLRGEIANVSARDESGNPDPAQATLVSIQLRIEDWGFLRRLETSVAWFGRTTSTGFLASLSRSVAGRGPASRFLALRSEPAVYSLDVRPDHPITVAELFGQTPGVTQHRRLGIRSMVNHLDRY